MGAVSVGQRNKMIDALSGTTTYTANAAVYAQLHVGDPGAAGTSNVATDTTRQVVTFAAAASGAAASSVQIQWTNLATADPDTITWVSFWTAAAAGTFLGSDDLPASKVVQDGDSLTIASGDVSLTVS